MSSLGPSSGPSYDVGGGADGGASDINRRLRPQHGVRGRRPGGERRRPGARRGQLWRRCDGRRSDGGAAHSLEADRRNRLPLEVGKRAVDHDVLAHPVLRLAAERRHQRFQVRLVEDETTLTIDVQKEDALRSFLELARVNRRDARRRTRSRFQFLSLDAALEKVRHNHDFNLRYVGERAFFISRRAQ